MKRIVIIGSSCSGKSTFAKRLSEKLELKHCELDQLHWLPNWQERPDTDFRELVTNVVSSEHWVIDGNYATARDIVWPRATQIIWLNHSFRLVLFRAFKRSIVRAFTKEKVCAGNIETFRHAFLSRDSIILWVLKTFHQKRKLYRHMLAEQQTGGVEVVELTTQNHVDEYLESV